MRQVRQLLQRHVALMLDRVSCTPSCLICCARVRLASMRRSRVLALTFGAARSRRPRCSAGRLRPFVLANQRGGAARFERRDVGEAPCRRRARGSRSLMRDLVGVISNEDRGPACRLGIDSTCARTQVCYDSSRDAIRSQSRLSRRLVSALASFRRPRPSPRRCSRSSTSRSFSTASKKRSARAIDEHHPRHGPRQERDRGSLRRVGRARDVSRGARQARLSSPKSARSRTSSTSRTSVRASRSDSATRCWSRASWSADEPFAVILADDVIDARAAGHRGS